PIMPQVPVASVRSPGTDGSLDAGTPTAPIAATVVGTSGQPPTDRVHQDTRRLTQPTLTQPTRPTRAREAQAADEELVATRSVPSYRAVPPSAPVPPTSSVPSTRATRVEQEPFGPGAGIQSADPDDDVPVIRSMPPAT